MSAQTGNRSWIWFASFSSEGDDGDDGDDDCEAAGRGSGHLRGSTRTNRSIPPIGRGSLAVVAGRGIGHLRGSTRTNRSLPPKGRSLAVVVCNPPRATAPRPSYPHGRRSCIDCIQCSRGRLKTKGRKPRITHYHTHYPPEARDFVPTHVAPNYAVHPRTGDKYPTYNKPESGHWYTYWSLSKPGSSTSIPSLLASRLFQ